MERDLADVRADRSLLLPGPLPPLSHLGATLLRHSVHVALRYALYQLGQSIPESAPTRFVALRLYLDAPFLRKSLGVSPASEEILGALLDPAGRALEPLPGRLRGVLWFHRARIARGFRAGRWFRSSPKPEVEVPPEVPIETQLSALLPALGDALLGDVIAALDRRRSRAEGKSVARAQSLQASRFLDGTDADLSRLGLPDPRVASWRDALPEAARDAATSQLAARRHRLRGGFREQYRYLLDRLRPSLLALGERAVARGHLTSSEDVFFLPWDLLDDVGGETKPSWLDQAIASNRQEWLELRGRKAPADTLGNVEPSGRLDLPDDLVPLWPLA